MDILANVYHKRIAENKKNIRFWEEYLGNLKALDFTVYSDKLKVPVLVPIGSRILFRGEIKHTNEVTVSLGADYIVKCSLNQADVLRQHRIKRAETQLQEFQKERDYLVGQISFGKQNVFEDQGQEIIEFHTEEDDKAWRQQHRDRVRQWKQQKKTEKTTKVNDITDEELWSRLEELELQEELEMEFYEDDNKDDNELATEDTKTFNAKEDEEVGNKTNKDKDVQLEIVNKKSASDSSNIEPKEITKHEDCIAEKKVKFKKPQSVKPTAQMELLQKVIDKQVELEGKLHEIRNKNIKNSKTEQDLIAKLDELDDLEELEDEMDRIEDLIEAEDLHEQSEGEDDESSSVSQSSDLKRRVSFADEDDSETLEITFHHSDIEPEYERYDSQKGIQKPSDIYEAYSHLFSETKSILKKTRYQDKNIDIDKEEKEIELKEEPVKENRTIEVKDIVEKVDVNNEKLMVNEEKRPVSLFKQRRQQQSRRS